MQHRLDTPEDCTRTDGEFPDIECHPALAETRPAVPRLPGFAAQLIGPRMRAMYETLAQDRVQDVLLELVRKVEAKEGPK